MFAALLLASVVCCAAGQRITIPFGRGWRWHRGDAPDGPGLGSGALASFNTSRGADGCSPMIERKEWTPGGDKSAGQRYSVCAVACSYQPGCTAYRDVSRDAMTGTASGCYHGDASTVCAGDGAGCGGAGQHPCTMQSLARAGGALEFQRDFSYTAPAFDDRAWPLATLPHDPLINQSLDPTAGVGAAFLPRQVVWYRKHFTLPTDFKGSHVYLYFEGAFQFSEVYLNGHHVMDHGTGCVNRY